MMKRVLGILTGACLALAIGCAQSYDLRIEKTLENMRYRRNLDKNTEAPPATSNLKNAQIFIRAPKGVKGPAQTFVYPVEQGKFDIADSFIDTDKQVSLHILARTNTPKQPAATKKGPNPAEGAEPPAPTAARGEFTADVVDFIKSAFSTDFDAAQLKPFDPPSHGRKGVAYKSATFDVGDKQVKVYFHGDKNGPGQIALIFEGPKEALRTISTQIDYSLNSLVVGPAASRYYSGQDEFGGEEAAPTPTGVF